MNITEIARRLRVTPDELREKLPILKFDIGRKAIKVDRNQLNKASIKVEGATVPLDPNSANGWNMTGDTTLELFGSACDAWRNPNAKNIEFNFPCEIIVE